MTRTQAPPPAAGPGETVFDAAAIKFSAQEAVACLLGGEIVKAINLRMIVGQPYYQIFVETGKPHYVNAVTGKLDPETDEIYAGEIASRFLSGMAVKKVAYLTNFDREYIGIFRLLPVYRFDGDDPKCNRVYVSTVTGSVARHTDNDKQFEANIFTTVHKFGFIRNKQIRDWSLMLVTAGIFVVAVLGVILFFLTGPKRKKTTSV
jgi:hypothetical protein